MKILNKKQVVLGILIFLSLVVLGLSAYIIYSLNNEEENLNIALEDSPVKIENTEEETNESIYVEVKGAVQNPGVYAMNERDLINDAINLAGGFLDNAYTDNINLSKKVTDELVIFVYTEKEYQNNTYSNTTSSNNDYQIDNALKNKVSIITSDSTNSDTGTSSLININLASITELMTLPGIGETKANNIISYREENGFFKAIEEIKNVSGIGDATFDQFKALITV